MSKFNMADKNKSRVVGFEISDGCGNDSCHCTGACVGKDVLPFDAKRDAIEYWTKEDNVIEGDKPNDITVKVSADVSEAITGFKALQREIRETTKAIREYEAAVEGVTIPSADITLDGKALGRAVTGDE